MDKFIFIDRDGTIVRDTVYLHRLEDLEFLPGAVDGLREMQSSLSAKFIIVTNQAGIAKKLYTEKDFHIFNNEMICRLRNAGISIAKIYFCPHHPDITGECECRKPKPGMINQAIKDFGLDPSLAIFIGDKDCDIELGQSFGAKTILITNGQYEVKAKPTAVAKDLIEAARLIGTHT
ncbi:MAG: HAD family hydrolase [Candidatus Yanofskybacteria bacterium]|nr:HAD family hydrolase [Candidatus Yanofskybacteria bacterium]